MSGRRIAVLTGTRAEYGLLQWVMTDVRDASDLDLQLVVAGAHLSPFHGHTVNFLLEDGFEPAARVETLTASDTAVGAAKAMALATIGVAEALDRLRPDLLVLLGDRTEVLAAAQAALVCRVPVVHLHGGEVTEGAIDESIRHAVTKLSALHLVAAEPYAERVRQLGEDPQHVHVVGAPGLDHLVRRPLMTREQLEASLGVALGSPLLLVTYHPVTATAEDGVAAVRELTDALDEWPAATVVVTLANADPGGAAVSQALRAWADGRDGAHAYPSLGHHRYISLLSLADAVVGNSSSGIIEAPAVGTPTVNVGPRQAGRLRAPSVHDVAPRRAAVADGLARALSAEGQQVAAARANPYGTAGEVSPRVLAALREVDPAALLVKPFHDRPGQAPG